MKPTILYDARPFQPQTRFWGPGIVLSNLISRLSSQFSFVGVAQKFADADAFNIKPWPVIPKVGSFIFEASPLWSPPFDIVWGTNHLLPQFCRTKPTIVTAHDILMLKYPKEQPYTRYFSWRLEASLKHASRIIAVSKTTAEDLLDLFPSIRSKLEVALLGYDPTFATTEDLAAVRQRFPGQYVLMLGAHRPRKNLTLAVAAVSRLQQKGIPIRLLVTGDIASSFGMLLGKYPDVVEQTGMLSRSEIVALLSHATALLFPSDYEGFGLPLLEAMAAKCPVLASDIPICREIAGAGALLLPKDPQGWANALENLIFSSSLKEELLERGETNLKRFDWNSTAKIYAQAFFEVLT